MVHPREEKMSEKCRKNVTTWLRKCYTTSFRVTSPDHFSGEKFTFLLLGFPFSPGEVHYLSFDFPVEICSSLLATQVVTHKSAKTTN